MANFLKSKIFLFPEQRKRFELHHKDAVLVGLSGRNYLLLLCQPRHDDRHDHLAVQASHGHKGSIQGVPRNMKQQRKETVKNCNARFIGTLKTLI